MNLIRKYKNHSNTPLKYHILSWIYSANNHIRQHCVLFFLTLHSIRVLFDIVFLALLIYTISMILFFYLYLKIRIFELIENDLVFDNELTKTIKMNHTRTMLCDHFIGIKNLERLNLLQNNPLVNEFYILGKEPETITLFRRKWNESFVDLTRICP